MRSPQVGIFVGHHGKGTGAAVGSRDEWTMCSAEAGLLAAELEADGLVRPLLVSLDKNQLRGVSFGRLADINLRVLLAVHNKLDAVVELHLNRSTLNTLLNRKAEGFEVFIRTNPGPRTRRLGEALVTQFSAELGNRNRGLKFKGFRLLNKLHRADIPAAILEPAFLTEDNIVGLEWRARYRGAIKKALYSFFNITQEVEHG